MSRRLLPAATSPPEPAPLDLSYRPDLSVMTVRWLRDVSFEELQAGFGAATALARTHRATRWLVDVRRRTLLDAFQSEWVAQQLLPQMAAALAPAALCIAYRLAPARFSSLRLQPSGLFVPAPGPDQNTTYELHTFAEEGPAMQWLLAQR